VEQFSVPEIIKPKVQTVEEFNSAEVIKPKIQTVERFNSHEVIRPKVESVDRCNSPDMSTQNNNDVLVPAFIEKEKKEIPQLNKCNTDQQSDIEKKITVLKRGSEEHHIDLSPTNKHGNIIFFNITKSVFCTDDGNFVAKICV